tara:strand:- start:521 stop:871 length:351 start_codon:yes stop_codon:yes gene_type:complete
MNLFVCNGRLVAPPEGKTLQSGTILCTFRLAIKARSGKYTYFIDCKSFGKTAERMIDQNLPKGQKLYIEDGELTEEKWTTKEGANRTKHSILCNWFYADMGANQNTETSDEGVNTF